MKTLTKNSTPSKVMSSWHNPFDRFFRNDLMDFWNKDAAETIPSINIKEEKDSYKIEVAAPGLKKEDFNIDVDGNLLTISCEKESEVKEEKDSENFSRKEYNYSSFSRSLTLPDNAESNRITAKYTEGILNLNIPKKPDSQKDKGQKIKVE